MASRGCRRLGGILSAVQEQLLVLIVESPFFHGAFGMVKLAATDWLVLPAMALRSSRSWKRRNGWSIELGSAHRFFPTGLEPEKDTGSLMAPLLAVGL